MDRNFRVTARPAVPLVALRKESVDRNALPLATRSYIMIVALRKESVDRNGCQPGCIRGCSWSLSARRAWIEIYRSMSGTDFYRVALRKESVDRNINEVVS